MYQLKLKLYYTFQGFSQSSEIFNDSSLEVLYYLATTLGNFHADVYVSIEPTMSASVQQTSCMNLLRGFNVIGAQEQQMYSYECNTVDVNVESESEECLETTEESEDYPSDNESTDDDNRAQEQQMYSYECNTVDVNVESESEECLETTEESEDYPSDNESTDDDNRAQEQQMYSYECNTVDVNVESESEECLETTEESEDYPSDNESTDDDNNVCSYQRICSALSTMLFLDQVVFAQFWAPIDFKSAHATVLSTRGQPFGLSTYTNEFWSYRIKCLDHNSYVNHNTKLCIGLPGRVFLNGSPEWTQDALEVSPVLYMHKYCKSYLQVFTVLQVTVAP
ncbi:hypothetical protein E3N88_30846 [Mikania micrantha]|uniref:Uncharacterized protein n=1 Tax=Mikania micrantha TaxID=192012 RepID=A0A5N6MNK1_9ASTR|nr:hypothetical protein E3N88_30846 [Mikania micrantha]